MSDFSLTLNEVSKTYRSRSEKAKSEVKALLPISLQISGDTPKVIAVAGESGSGKTTLASLLLGFQSPTSGTIDFNGVPLTALSKEQRNEFRRTVQPVLQDPFSSYNQFYKIDHVLEMPLKNYGLAKNSDESSLLIRKALSDVGLIPEQTLGRYPSQLSGGQRQRIMLARLLLCKPRLIVADEPVSMIDSSYRAIILSMLLKLKTEHQINILYITHDVATAYQISDKLIVLYKGRVVEAGDTKSIVENPKHPYTESLITSIPVPDRIRSWDKESVAIQHGLLNETGCEYTDHCQHAIPQCKSVVPNLRHFENNHLVACRLYENSSAAQPSDLAKTI